MKLMKLFAVLALVGISNAAFGHNFTLYNDTNKAITVKVVTKGQEATKTITQGNGDVFMFATGECLKSVFVNGNQASINSSKGRCQDIDDFHISEVAGKYTIRAGS
jgi:hypothetical protein